jgi:hypothetical protein
MRQRVARSVRVQRAAATSSRRAGFTPALAECAWVLWGEKVTWARNARSGGSDRDWQLTRRPLHEEGMRELARGESQGDV